MADRDDANSGDSPSRAPVVHSVAIGLAIADAQQDDHPIIGCNQAFEDITGYSTAEVLGRNCRFLQRDDRDQQARQVIRHALANGQECRVLLRNYRKDGSLFWNDLTLYPILDQANTVTHFVGLIHDVTSHSVAEEKTLEREARLQAVLDTAVEAIITIDERGRCQSLNRSAERMFGYTADEVLGQNISMLMPEPYRSEHDQYLRHYLQTGEKKIIGIGREAIGRRKNGDTFPIHLSVSEVQLTERRLFTGIVQDLTERKRAEQRLVQSERLAVLGEAMARLAHEGRNALQRIQTAVETARIHAGDDSPLTGQLGTIERAGDALNALLEEMRNYAAPLQLETSSASLAAIWREAWQSAVGPWSSRQATLLERGPYDRLRGRVDRLRLEQVFRNLFENALAVCDAPAEVRVVVEVLPAGTQRRWRISVEDNGPGLTPDQLERAFEPFFTTKAKGTGLGLAIARRIIEAHHGTISAGNAPSGGARFVIELPG